MWRGLCSTVCVSVCIVLFIQIANAQESGESSAAASTSENSAAAGDGPALTPEQVKAAREYIDLVFAPSSLNSTKEIDTYIQEKFARHPYLQSFFLHSMDVATGTPVATFLGNNIRAYKIAKPDMLAEDGPPQEAKPLPKKKRILFTSGIHGDERVGVVHLLDYMGYVLRNPAVQKRIEDAGMELWFIPIINPDGYDYVRRKNLHLAPCLGMCTDWQPTANGTGPVSSSTIAPGTCRPDWVTEWNSITDEWFKANAQFKREDTCRQGVIYGDGSYFRGGTDIDSNFPSFQPDLLEGKTCRSAAPLAENFSPSAILLDEKTGIPKFKMDIARNTALEAETSAVMMFAESIQPWAAISVHSGAETGAITLPNREVTCQQEDFFLKHVCGGWDNHRKLNHVPTELQKGLACGHSGNIACGNLEDFLTNHYGTISLRLDLQSGKRLAPDKPPNTDPAPADAPKIAGFSHDAYWKQLRILSEFLIEFIAGLSTRLTGPHLAPSSASELYKTDLKSFKCRLGEKDDEPRPDGGAPVTPPGNNIPTPLGNPQVGEAPPAVENQQNAGGAPDNNPNAGGDSSESASGSGDDAPDARFGGRRVTDSPSDALRTNAHSGDSSQQSSVAGISKAIDDIEEEMRKEKEQLPHWTGKIEPKHRPRFRKVDHADYVLSPPNDLYEAWPW